MNVRVSLAFAQLPDAELAAFAENIIDSLTGNPTYPTPAVSIANLTTVLTAFTDALAAAAQGGPMQTAAKNAARETLLSQLRLEANYVQGIAGDNLAELLSSGFQSINTNRAQSPLDKPMVVGIDNEMSTQLVLRLQPVNNARAYEVQVKNGGGWLPAGIFTQA